MLDIYEFFQNLSSALVKGAGLVIEAIIQECVPNVSKKIQELPLGEETLMKYLHIGLYDQFNSRKVDLLVFNTCHTIQQP